MSFLMCGGRERRIIYQTSITAKPTRPQPNTPPKAPGSIKIMLSSSVFPEYQAGVIHDHLDAARGFLHIRINLFLRKDGAPVQFFDSQRQNRLYITLDQYRIVGTV
ncbi:MAG: hypothetical protein MI923_00115 [Phycisphaerales bacterium]|nr:hypothetical protein [Phycisphaerales bacterium]